MQRWMDSKAGQTFLNYAYSWGASIVILGTLFKLTHLPGANLMLFIGMGTEVVVFFLSAFDRPFESDDEETATPRQAGNAGGQAVINGAMAAAGVATEGDDAETADNSGIAATTAGGTIVAGGGPAIVGGGTTIIGGGNGGTIVLGGGAGEAGSITGEPAGTDTSANSADTSATSPFSPSEGLQTAASQQGIGGNSLLDIIRLANEELLQRAQASLTPEMEEASKQYVEKLQLLTETLDRVEKQSARLTTDSEEMTNLNRTLTGINTVYELQLKSVSQQIGTIDSINEQTRKMAAQIEELNGVYARMIKALTVNMRNAATPMGE